MGFERIVGVSGRRGFAAAVGVAVLMGGAAYTGWALTPVPGTTVARPGEGPAAPTTAPSTASTAAVGAAPAEDVPPAAPAPDGLPEIDYDPAPAGFPDDPDTLDTTPLTEGVRPTRRLAAYDGPGGKPVAFLMPTISGVEITVPIARTEVGWTAVLLPSANRKLAWLPPGGFRTVALRDQIVVERVPYRLTWYRDGAAQRSWQVSLGQRGQETPLGRTFVLGRTPPPQSVYAGVDIYALGSIPDDLDSVPASLRGAHIGIHTWYHDGELGQMTTNGCIRLTASGQRVLLAEVPEGTPVVVVDELPTPPPTAAQPVIGAR
ncbi:L,D-transpeptidase family protein [Micromonospora sp. WMMD1082]|uniref:L,D-transpeptidase family protein n=1 Tax=Micromonospora sp. WMMD1082 TaxID=3016104 RepID=UPI002416B2FF|nr:L,D-transpeptidase family protein [Micromonospora sp. WMMD1082]MDG4796317.1 L,D-transpeptidase family protein [Micromonospora sp. WMMD1082]